MRDAYLATLYDLAKDKKSILALVGDAGGTLYDKFRADFPNQFINLGLQEANMITVAAGLASCGYIPFTFAIAPHLTMRTYEQIRNDVCLNNKNVKIVGVGAGLHYSNQGPTHHATEDFAILRVLPHMTIFSPTDPMEMKKVTIAAANINGPVYIRMGSRTPKAPNIYQQDYNFEVGKGVMLRDGKDAAIIATGSLVYEALQAAEELEKDNISARVINIHTIKPIDKEIILKAAKETRLLVTVEEHQLQGGFGDSVASVILESCNERVKFKRIGINDVFCSWYGTYIEIKEHYGLTKENIVKQVKNLYGGIQ